MKSIALWSLLLGAAAVAQQIEYEYVIIGSGPGGGTLAANLARDGHSVFLIEAGDNQGHNLTEVIPGLLGILYPRGSTLGGSSEVNGMNWALPPDNDWRYIATLTNDDSWRPEQMRQYFMELERNEYLPEGIPGHGYDGGFGETDDRREELQRLGIPVVVDLPAVENNMRDNYEGDVVVQANVDFENNPFANCTYSLSNQSDPCLEQWENDHTGPYGEGGAPLIMWYRSKQSQNNDSDVFFFGGASAVFRGYFPGYSREQVPASTFYWSMVKMKPCNAACIVELRSTSPREAPLINFNYFDVSNGP
ncbi:hypothetical protein M409DRAFT_30154 [Zasmidium cellare ATCC 36951]|uniref:Glucose-methanol-choline oxidoreductase N-terminal domain-containing protein n=1 Tax=Zasmidium cellare ATCC 36951 TaxID=1080233 RepID=A0A6A6BX39_ZASCE|nr:uncharacterized protein M409DRAFT_30154 [Zasmidium cellare ATCC 36951]KAF2159404.1 hypothetical protein M409DRAFT_30154 [Zasmidium cellare ATCC 36951]